MLEKWKRLRTEERLKCGIFRVEEKTFRVPRSGKEKIYVSAVGADWVNCIPVTSGREVVFVKQFRHARESISLEIPGGLVDPGEGPRDAAARELREETGFAADSFELVGSVEPNPAILDLLCHTYLATDVKYDGLPCPDESEELEVVLLPLDEVPGMIRDGRISHSLVISAFTLLALERGGLEL